jgi:hypothetical protein
MHLFCYFCNCNKKKKKFSTPVYEGGKTFGTQGIVDPTYEKILLSRKLVKKNLPVSHRGLNLETFTETFCDKVAK